MAQANSPERTCNYIVIDILHQATIIVEPLDALQNLCFIVNRVFKRGAHGSKFGLQLELDESSRILHRTSLALEFLKQLHGGLLANLLKVLHDVEENNWLRKPAGVIQRRNMLRYRRVLINHWTRHIVRAGQRDGLSYVICGILYSVCLDLKFPQQNHGMGDLETVQHVGNLRIVDGLLKACEEIHPGYALGHLLIIIDDVRLRPDPTTPCNQVLDEFARIFLI
mmetsp:Transcript_19334/g.37978  ORF Transcript_19334/g.37978 Transcript_19334/m.37978 type:complete len:224 (+) Transcript_19334:1084-1755(+)